MTRQSGAPSPQRLGYVVGRVLRAQGYSSPEDFADKTKITGLSGPTVRNIVNAKDAYLSEVKLWKLSSALGLPSATLGRALVGDAAAIDADPFTGKESVKPEVTAALRDWVVKSSDQTVTERSRREG